MVYNSNMKEADKFKKYGFDIKETIDSDVETTTDDDSIKEQMNSGYSNNWLSDIQYY